MIRNAVGTVMSRMAVAATMNRTTSRFAAARSTSSPPSRITATTSPTVSTPNSGIAVKMTLPGSVSRFQDFGDDGHLSTPPMIGSRLRHDAMVSARRWPGIITPTAWRWMNDGSWMRIRNGWSVPSLTA